MAITLKAARINKGLSQKEAAKKIGVAVDTLSNYERGKSFPDVPTIQRIEQVYGFLYNDIIFCRILRINRNSKGGPHMKQKPERAKPPSLAPFVLAPQRTDGEPYTTSEIIAEGTGIDRRKVRDAIRKYKTDLEAFGKVASYQAAFPGSKTGQSITGYILNEQQATFLLTLLKNTPVVVAFKKELVRQFYAMRSLLLERASPIWQDTRSLGKEIRRQETDAIRRLVDYATAQGSRNARRYYTSLSRLADRTAGIVERDKAQVVQLTTLLLVERMIAQEITTGIEAGRHYKEIYSSVKDRLAVFSGVGILAGEEAEQ